MSFQITSLEDTYQLVRFWRDYLWDNISWASGGGLRGKFWENVREEQVKNIGGCLKAKWVWLVCEGGGGHWPVSGWESSCLTYGGTPGPSPALLPTHPTLMAPILMKVSGVRVEEPKGPSWPPSGSFSGVGWVPGGSRWERRGRRDAFLGIIGEHSLASLFLSNWWRWRKYERGSYCTIYLIVRMLNDFQLNIRQCSWHKPNIIRMQ